MTTSVGTVPIGSWPLAPGATTVPVVAGNSAPSFTAPPESGTLTINGITVTVQPYDQDPGNLVLYMNEAGISTSIDRFGRIVISSVVSLSGNSLIRGAMGLSTV